MQLLKLRSDEGQRVQNRISTFVDRDIIPKPKVRQIARDFGPFRATIENRGGLRIGTIGVSPEAREAAKEGFLQLIPAFEAARPTWFQETLLSMVRMAIASVRQSIEQGTKHWPNPKVTIFLGVDEWDWARTKQGFLGLTDSYAHFKDEDFLSAEALSKRVWELWGRYCDLTVLTQVTNYASHLIRDGQVYAVLPEFFLEMIQKAPEAQRQKMAQVLFRPLVISSPATSFSGYPGLWPRLERLPLPTLSNAEFGGKSISYRVEFHPLVVNETEKVCYFPIEATVSFARSATSPVEWEAAELSDTWDLFLSEFDYAIALLHDEPGVDKLTTWSDQKEDRRIELIQKKRGGRLSDDERRELEELQQESALHRDIIHPLPFATLKAFGSPAKAE